MLVCMFFQYWTLVLNNQLVCFSLGKTIPTLTLQCKLGPGKP